MATNKAAKGTMWLWYALMVVSTLVSGVQAQTLPPSAPVEFIPSGSAQGDNIGHAVALSREFAVVGAPGVDTATLTDCGAVYVYRKSAGQWSLMQTLQPVQLGDNHSFGSSVAVYQPDPNDTEDTRIIVGAPGSGSLSGAYRGAAYVYKLSTSPDEWVQENVFEAPDAVNSQRFGYSVAIANNTVVVGDRYDETHYASYPSKGMAYVYKYLYIEGQGVPPEFQLGWDYFSQVLAPQNLNAINFFGASVAISRDESTILVGNTRTASPDLDGAVDVYALTGGQYQYVVELLPCDTADAHAQYFGTSVAIDDDWIVVGAPLFGNACGSVYAYNKQGATWADHVCRHLSRHNAMPGDYLGWWVDIDGPIIVAGAPGFGSHEDYLNVYRFGSTIFAENSWVEQPKMTEFGGLQDALFGHGVAVDEQVTLAGAPDSDDDAHSILDTGSFFIINTIVSIEPGCPGDIASDGSRFASDEPDGYIGVADFFALLQSWGTCANPADCPADVAGATVQDPPDGDVGVSDFFYILQHWGPCDVEDTDGDGITDFWEEYYGISAFDDPTDAYVDHDGDGLSTLDEITVYQTHPNNADTDGDGVSDGAEQIGGSDPNDATDNGIGPNSDNVVYVMIEFGDPSCHYSDVWHMHFGGVEYEFVHDAVSSGCEEPDPAGNCELWPGECPCHAWDCYDHAPQQKGPIAIDREQLYEIRMTHHGSAYRNTNADYDWACLVYLCDADGSNQRILMHDTNSLPYVDEWEPLPPIDGFYVYDPQRITGKAWGQTIGHDPIGKAAWLVVSHVDLDIDSDNNNGYEAPDETVEEDAIEDDPSMPGKFIVVNDDDDNDNDLHDDQEPDNQSILDENDLVPVKTTLDTIVEYQWVVEATGTHLRIWRNQDRSELVTLGQLQTIPLPETLWIEGIAPGASEITLTIKNMDADTLDSDTVRVTVIDLDIKKLQYADHAGLKKHTIKKDIRAQGSTSQVDYPTPEIWDKNNDGDLTYPDDHMSPIAYTRNTNLEVEYLELSVDFGGYTPPPLQAGQPANVLVHGIALRGHQGAVQQEFSGNGIYTAGTGSQNGEIVVAAVDEVVPIPLLDSIQCYSAFPKSNPDPYAIKWALVVGDYTIVSDHIQTESELYITAVDPVLLTGTGGIGLFHTVIDVACRSAEGLNETQEQLIIDGVWSGFTGRNVVRAEDRSPQPRVLKYYQPWSTQILETKDLLHDGNGQCHSWTRFFLDCLKVHDIQHQNNFVLVTPGSASHGFMVKKWTFTTSAGASSSTSHPYLNLWPNASATPIVGNAYVFTWEQVTDGTQELEGQGGAQNPNPQSIFGNHSIAKLNNKYYDPSYGGQTYSTFDAYENAAIDGYYQGPYLRNYQESVINADLNGNGNMLDTVP
jgi:hypothetical protein